MKRSLLVAALLAASPILAGSAKAEPLQMFNITTPAAGVVNFSGTGTANFNQSLGTNNSFNVGSSTNLGVNASASSTEDYTSVGSASLDLAGTSRLQQTIGTATSAFNASTAAESSSRAAHVSAFEVANSTTYGAQWTNEWNSGYAAEQGWEYRAEGEANADSGAGYYEIGGEAGYKTEAQWEASSKSAWQAGWDQAYSTAYTNAYETAVTSANQASAQTDEQGIIKGAFKTTETGDASAAMGALTASFESGATAAANAEHGASYNADDGNYSSEAAWEAAWEASYQQAYSAAFSSAATSLQRESISNVDVQGIGVIADVNAGATSNFTATSQLIDGAARDGNGNGNASAGASLATSSYANQSNSTTASAFMQAFSGGLPDGDLTITGVTGSSTTGYTVQGERTTTSTETYTVAADGTVTQN